MVGYIEKSLGKEETLLRKARFHGLYYITAWVVLGVIFMGSSVLFYYLRGDRGPGEFWVWHWLVAFFALLALIVLAFRMMPIWTTEIGVTNQRVIIKRGWLVRSTEEMQLRAIEQIKLRQGIAGRIFNFGRLDVFGYGKDDLRIPAIAAPLEFLKAVQGAASKVGPVHAKPAAPSAETPDGGTDAAPPVQR